MHDARRVISRRPPDQRPLRLPFLSAGAEALAVLASLGAANTGIQIAAVQKLGYPITRSSP